MDTKAIQRRLIELGYSVGASGADGILGRNTTAAVAAFQRDRKLPIKWPGTIGPMTTAALFSNGELPPVGNGRPPWYDEALRRVGLHETADNTALRRYLKSDGATLGDPSKLPWCGDFVETVIALTLPGEPMVTNPYWARNWLKFGINCDKRVALGAVAVFERLGGGGHVGFVAGHDREYLHILGGNQSNRVSIAKLAKSRCLGLRWPRTFEPIGPVLPFTTLNATISTNEA